MLPTPDMLEVDILNLTPISEIAIKHNCPEMELREAIADPSHELYHVARKAKASLGELLRGKLLADVGNKNPQAESELRRRYNQLYHEI